MSRYVSRLLILAALSSCSGETPGDAPSAQGAGESGGAISGPFPKTIRGTIGYSYPLQEGGPIKFDLLEHPGATFIISGADYDAKSGIDEDDAEISVTIEPISADQCGGDGQCFRAY